MDVFVVGKGEIKKFYEFYFVSGRVMWEVS